MTQPIPDLQFDHATYEQPKTGVACGMCGKLVGHEYWQWMGRVACASCREQVRGLEAKANAPETFAKAAVLATGAALACGIAYAVFVAIAKWNFSLITIGIGYVVGTVIRKSTGNISGRRYQVLAVVLTYLASTMQYLPAFDIDLTLVPLHSVPKLLGYMLAAPFITATESPLGLVIVGIGLWEAWRRTRGLPMAVTGPFRVAPAGQVPAP